VSLERWKADAASAQPRMRGVEAALHEDAVLAAGWHDFGEPGYRVGLDHLLRAIETSRYTEAQRDRIRHNLVGRVLRSRLYSERGWHDRPQVLDLPLQPPVIVVGLPRTGTTTLQKLLSMDGQFQGLNGWLVTYPMPRPPKDTWPSIAEYRRVAAIQEAAMKTATSMKAAHLRTADEVDEPLELISQSFVSNFFPALVELPEYDDWFRQQDLRPTYRRFANNLRLIGANEPGKPWLLQNPTNILGLDSLLAVFPDARLLWTHRHPAEALASMTSLLGGVRKAILGPQVSTSDVGPRELSLWSEAIPAALDVRERHPQNFFDVDFRALGSDPVGTVRGIYRRFGLAMTTATEAAMQAWAQANPKGTHGVHSYSREQLGFDDAVIDRHFAGYVERFSLA
jgi:hypothetical protein